jgi:hypothetical protein
MEKQKIAVMGLSAVGLIGTFLPWASVGGLAVDGTAGGGDGYITLIFFAMVLLITVLNGMKEQYTLKSLITVSILGLLCALIGFYDISNVNNPMVKIGIGLYLIVGTGLGIIGAAFGLRASK